MIFEPRSLEKHEKIEFLVSLTISFMKIWIFFLNSDFLRNWEPGWRKGGYQSTWTPVQERDGNITFVTIFSCGSVWKREILIKIRSRWTRNWKNGTSPKIMIFFILCLYGCKKWKNDEFLACHSSFLIKNHWKIMIFGFCVFEKRKKCNFRLVFV